MIIGNLSKANHFLQGVWVNEKYNVKIEIISDGEELMVFGIEPRREKGQQFFRTSRRWYYDNFGNSIKVEDDNCIQLRYLGRWSKITFNKVSDILQTPPPPPLSPPPTANQNRHSSGLPLEGTWYSEDLKADLYLIEDRNGFKIAFKQGDWKYFEKIDANLYRDNVGNTYTLHDNGIMSWVAADRSKVFVISKKSATIPW